MAVQMAHCSEHCQMEFLRARNIVISSQNMDDVPTLTYDFLMKTC